MWNDTPMGADVEHRYQDADAGEQRRRASPIGVTSPQLMGKAPPLRSSHSSLLSISRDTMGVRTRLRQIVFDPTVKVSFVTHLESTSPNLQPVFQCWCHLHMLFRLYHRDTLSNVHALCSHVAYIIHHFVQSPAPESAVPCSPALRASLVSLLVRVREHPCALLPARGVDAPPLAREPGCRDQCAGGLRCLWSSLKPDCLAAAVLHEPRRHVINLHAPLLLRNAMEQELFPALVAFDALLVEREVPVFSAVRLADPYVMHEGPLKWHLRSAGRSSSLQHVLSSVLCLDAAAVMGATRRSTWARLTPQMLLLFEGSHSVHAQARVGIPLDDLSIRLQGEGRRDFALLGTHLTQSRRVIVCNDAEPWLTILQAELRLHVDVHACIRQLQDAVLERHGAVEATASLDRRTSLDVIQSMDSTKSSSESSAVALARVESMGLFEALCTQGVGSWARRASSGMMNLSSPLPVRPGRNMIQRSVSTSGLTLSSSHSSETLEDGDSDTSAHAVAMRSASLTMINLYRSVRKHQPSSYALVGDERDWPSRATSPASVNEPPVSVSDRPVALGAIRAGGKGTPLPSPYVSGSALGPTAPPSPASSAARASTDEGDAWGEGVASGNDPSPGTGSPLLGGASGPHVQRERLGSGILLGQDEPVSPVVAPVGDRAMRTPPVPALHSAASSPTGYSTDRMRRDEALPRGDEPAALGAHPGTTAAAAPGAADAPPLMSGYGVGPETLVAIQDMQTKAEQAPQQYDFTLEYQHCLDQLRDCTSVDFGRAADRRMVLQRSLDLIKVNDNFITLASRYGRLIVSEFYLPIRRKTIQPVQFGGMLGGQKYCVHGCLFKFALADEGGTSLFDGNHELASKVAGHDLKGLVSYQSISKSLSEDVHGVDHRLCYPLMALIDYKGFRLIATSLLPIDATTLRYGSADAGKTVHSDNEALTALVARASERLNLAPHRCGSANVLMYSAVDLEGHVGHDGRFYMLDFSRAFPPVTPSSSSRRRNSHLYELFRPEFVKNYYGDSLCPDAHSRFISDASEAVRFRAEIYKATQLLLSHVVAEYCDELTDLLDMELIRTGHLSDFSLTQSLHRRGINVRYLGRIAQRLGDHPYARLVLLNMAARILKNDLRARLRTCAADLRLALDEPFHSTTVAFLNSVFGSSKASNVYWESVEVQMKQKFALCADTWIHWPSEGLKSALFQWLHFGDSQLLGPFYLWTRLQRATGLRVASTVVDLLSDDLSVYQQAEIFDGVSDVLDIGLRVKHVTDVANSHGFCLMMRGRERESSGQLKAARSCYIRALDAFELSLTSCPTDNGLLKNAALCCVDLDRVDHQIAIAMGRVNARQQQQHRRRRMSSSCRRSWKDVWQRVMGKQEASLFPTPSSPRAVVFSDSGSGSDAHYSGSEGSDVSRSGGDDDDDGDVVVNGDGSGGFDVGSGDGVGDEEDVGVHARLQGKGEMEASHWLQTAEAYFVRAIRAGWHDAVSHMLYASLLWSLGRLNAAELHYLIALHLAPHSPVILRTYAGFLRRGRRDVEMSDEFMRRA